MEPCIIRYLFLANIRPISVLISDRDRRGNSGGRASELNVNIRVCLIRIERVSVCKTRRPSNSGESKQNADTGRIFLCVCKSVKDGQYEQMQTS